ncbi:MAG: anhydro-N-acetylmuramic acid kinase, partial [Kingella sp. (in: b-proteobacteria)]
MTQRYIGIMSGTSMDGADAVLIETDGTRWHRAAACESTPYSGSLKAELLDLQNIGSNELHRSRLL